jgi:hypothetical protein
MNPARRALRLLSTALLLALLLPLLAACGGAAPGAALAPTGAPNQGDIASAPTAASTLERPVASAPTTAAMTAAEPTAAPAFGDVDAGAGPPASEAPMPQATQVVAGGTAARPEGQQSQLKAGERDDNKEFAAYLDYLRSYAGPPALAADVSERYLITVRDQDQRPVLDARVRAFDGGQQVFEGRTYAGGTTIMLPRALGISDNAGTLRIVAEQGNSTAEATLTRGQQERVELALRDVSAQPLKLDVLFLLDATGSMGDEIGKIQQSIASIAERIDAFQPRPALRFGLVAYKDRGDDYVTRVYDFTPDVATFRQLLMSVQAQGGGDTPESLNEGMRQAMGQLGWADGAVRLTFLVADAPPHLDYGEEFDYQDAAREAVARGVKIYPIAASNTDQQAEYVFRQLAQQTLASFIFLTYQPGASSGAPGETTQLDAGDSPQGFTVERLDDLVVQIVERELGAAVGAV